MTAAGALQPDELLLLVNSTNPAGERCAELYAKARQVPAGRILSLNLPNHDEIPFDQYEREVVPAVRAYLRRNGLAAKVRCIVTFHGVPLRITARKVTPELQKEVADIRAQSDEAIGKLAPIVDDAEKFAREVNPEFQPGGPPGGVMEALLARSNKAMGT